MSENSDLENIREILESWSTHLREGIENQLMVTEQRIDRYAGKTTKEYSAWMMELTAFEPPTKINTKEEFKVALAAIEKYTVRAAFLTHHLAAKSLSRGKLPKTLNEMIGAEMLLRMSIKSGQNGITQKEARVLMAQLGASAKLAADPKQKEKQFIFECWQNWQKKPDNYPSKAAFARDMLPKCEHLTSQKKIEDWCREWGKSNSAG
jgi:hypothetical protein